MSALVTSGRLLHRGDICLSCPRLFHYTRIKSESQWAKILICILDKMEYIKEVKLTGMRLNEARYESKVIGEP